MWRQPSTKLQALRQRGKAFGRRFGDVAVGDFWLEAFGGGPDAAQQSQFVALVKLSDADRVGLARVAGELGVDANRQVV